MDGTSAGALLAPALTHEPTPARLILAYAWDVHWANARAFPAPALADQSADIQ